MVPEQLLLEATAANTSFSRDLPGLQIAVDSTSLGEFKQCPRKYYYTVVLGYQGRHTNAHLTFGLVYHAACERYDHAKVSGADHEEALGIALTYAMKETWDQERKRPWYSEHPVKNRLTLVQAILGYLDLYGKSDPMETIILPNGKPAVELSFAFELGAQACTGEQWLLCGHLDKLGKLGDRPVIADKKTTTMELGPRYFQSFSPGNQFSLYALAGRIAWSLPISEIVVDACQVLMGGARFQRTPVARSESILQEWLEGTKWWLEQMQSAALAREWPQNDKACDLYGGCAFRSTCAKAPSSRDAWMNTDFRKRIWDPLQRRGDI
jgi:hypothetical protein